MIDFIEKLTSYNLFNYLLPGILFAVISEELTKFSFIQKNLILGVFVYYFIGLIISRIGSLIIEPILRKISFLKFTPYNEFVKASKEDSKIEILSEQNNLYRTLCSTFIVLLFLKLYEVFEIHFSLGNWNNIILLLFLLILFLFSYKKQTLYITKRIEANMKETIDKSHD